MWCRRAVTALILTLVLIPQPASSQELRPLVVEWETIFRIDWSLAGEQVTGQVVNHSGLSVKRVRLLVEALEGGRVVGQRVSWLGNDLTAGSRAHFAEQVPARASAYRVSVFDYEIRFGLAASRSPARPPAGEWP